MDKDRLMKKRVEDELEWTPDIGAAGVGAAVDQGVVTLTGHVATYSEKLGRRGNRPADQGRARRGRRDRSAPSGRRGRE